jgi:Zn-dependent peptidase ImmA (M78 family)
MDRRSIQSKVRELHKELWYRQDELWPGRQLTAIQMLEPKAAAEVLGLSYEEYPDLGSSTFRFRGQQMRVAGLLDRQASKIAVSTEFPVKTIRFTAAHEIGHWVLHPGEIMHRDRPMDGSRMPVGQQAPIELEANYFAACFLMPENLLRTIFGEMFGPEPFVFDDAVAFYLGKGDSESLLRAEENALDREFALARCTSLGGPQFISLADRFRVADSAMARRLKELKLIRWP